MSLLHTFCRRLALRAILKECIYQPRRLCTTVTGKENLNLLSKFIQKEEKVDGVQDYVIADEKREAISVSWDTSIRYMESEAYKETYGDDPVWKNYRRNYKGHYMPETRLTCIRKGKIGTGSPCPLCRDEYLVVDYRNLKLLYQFLNKFTGEVMPSIKTGVCQKRHNEILIEVCKAVDYGFIQTQFEERYYDYEDFYKLAKESLERSNAEEIQARETSKLVEQSNEIGALKKQQVESELLDSQSEEVSRGLKLDGQDSSHKLDLRSSNTESDTSSSDSSSSDEDSDSDSSDDDMKPGTRSDEPVKNVASETLDKPDTK